MIEWGYVSAAANAESKARNGKNKVIVTARRRVHVGAAHLSCPNPAANAGPLVSHRRPVYDQRARHVRSQSEGSRPPHAIDADGATLDRNRKRR